MLARPVGRRERKKSATRDRLRAAGFELFATRGYVATTVRDITEAADVAERTFYRHFESKEALLLDDLRRYFAAAEDLVAARPDDEGPMTSLLAVVRELRDEWEVPRPQLTALTGLVLGDDAPRGYLHKLVDEHQERLSWLFARRRGLDRPDYRCHLEAAVAGVAFNQSIGYFVNEPTASNFDLGFEAIRLFAAGCDPEAVAGLPALDA